MPIMQSWWASCLLAKPGSSFFEKWLKKKVSFMEKISIDEQIEIFTHGCVEVISRDDLRAKLELAEKEGRPLRIKYGADPSTADIHLGHTVPLRKLRRLQDIGHHVYFLIGDFTAVVGDPSGRSETRKMLSLEQVKENALTYQAQVFKILDREKTTVVYNSEWLGKLSSYELMTLTSKYTVARLLERDDFKKRFTSDKPISLLEFMYPLLQGYDSVVLENDIEIGGTDQTFNLLVGRVLQKDYGKASQVVLTLPLIEGTDGVQKMSKTFGNSINLNDTSTNMFGKIMSLPDSLMVKYFTYLTEKTVAEIKEIEAQMETKAVNPRDLKVSLASEIVAFYYGQEEADRAIAEFNTVFQKKGIPDNVPTHCVDFAERNVVDLVAEFSLVVSKSEARRLIKQGGLRVNGEKISDPNMVIGFSEEVLIQCGKRMFAKFFRQ